jgi:uncharacterized membrane protein HdeD (DUF308 family)
MTSPAQAELIAARFGPATLAYGGFLVAAALLSMLAPFAIGSAMTALLGCVFLAAGAIGALAMFADWNRHALWWRAIWAATAVATGVVLLAVTLDAGAWNAPLIGACFAFQGLAIALFAYAHRRHAGRRWIPVAVSGLLAAAMGGLVVTEFPFEAGWVLAGVAAVNLISYGAALMFVGLEPRRQSAPGTSAGR